MLTVISFIFWVSLLLFTVLSLILLLQSSFFDHTIKSFNLFWKRTDKVASMLDAEEQVKEEVNKSLSSYIIIASFISGGVVIFTIALAMWLS